MLLSSFTIAQQQAFHLDKITLTPGIFKNAQDVDVKYILALNPDKLLAPYLIDAGLPLKAERYGNWESSGLDGHIGGHYLSALALAYAATDNKELKQRLDYMVDQLDQCQKKNGNGYVGGIPQGKVFWERIKKGDIDGSSFGLNNTWVPLYNIDKLFAGLYDAYAIGGNEQALKVLIGLSDWMIDMFANLNDEQLERVLRTEHGGLNAAFTDVYSATKNKKYLDAAQRLTQKAFLNPMIQQKDILTGLHANTQIPKVLGIEKINHITHNHDWQKASEFFWSNVANERSVAFGGNSYREHFHELDRFDKMLETNQGPETCNSYNMLKLSKELYFRTGDTKYLDFYEKTMFNHILSSQHPENGGLVYFTPIRPNHYRVYSQPETSMWCCVGTGIENHVKYGELIYTHEKNALFVNLFVSSKVDWKGLTFSQTTNFPYENKSVFKFEGSKKVKGTLKVRIPSWMQSPKLTLNGKPLKIFVTKGFVSIAQTWKKNDELVLTFDAEVNQEVLPSHPQWTAFKYGPIALAQETSKEDLVGLYADDSRMGHETRGKLFPLNSGHVFVSDTKDVSADFVKGNNLTFKYDGVTLKPFFAVHDTRYQMYFQVLNWKEFEQHKESLAKETVSDDKAIDKIDLGQQQPEADHGYKGEQSDSGYESGAFWRNTSGYISYDLTNSNKKGKKLYINALEVLNKGNLRVEINGKEQEFNLISDKQLSIDVSSFENISLKIQPRESGKRTPRLTKIIIN